jgi:hypothetical protein
VRQQECSSRRIADVLASVRAEEERQGARLLGPGGIHPHGAWLAAEGGGVPGQPEEARADRLGGAGPGLGQKGAAAPVPFRSTQLSRAARRPGPGADQGHQPRASTRFRRCLAGTWPVATLEAGRTAGVTHAGRERAGAVASSGGDLDAGAVLRASQRTAHCRYLVPPHGLGGPAGGHAGAGSSPPAVRGT